MLCSLQVSAPVALIGRLCMWAFPTVRCTVRPSVGRGQGREAHMFTLRCLTDLVFFFFLSPPLIVLLLLGQLGTVCSEL